MSDEQGLDRSVGGITFRVTGRVQGVFYRVFGRNAAEALGLNGWIRNESDGSVTGAAFGSPKRLRRYLDQLREGPRASRVEELSWEPVSEAEGPGGFEIRY